MPGSREEEQDRVVNGVALNNQELSPQSRYSASPHETEGDAAPATDLFLTRRTLVETQEALLAYRLDCNIPRPLELPRRRRLRPCLDRVERLAAQDLERAANGARDKIEGEIGGLACWSGDGRRGRGQDGGCCCRGQGWHLCRGC